MEIRRWTGSGRARARVSSESKASGSGLANSKADELYKMCMNDCRCGGQVTDTDPATCHDPIDNIGIISVRTISWSHGGVVEAGTAVS